MKVINKYQANDCSIFNTEKECKDYELLTKKVDLIMNKLAPLPKDDFCRFANGGGYIQQNKDAVKIAKTQLTELGNKTFKINVGFEIIGKYFDDSNNHALYSAWGRLSAIDNKSREWGQTFFAINPTKGTQEPFKIK